MDRFNVCIKDLQGDMEVTLEHASKFYVVPVEYLLEHNIDIQGFQFEELSADTPVCCVETDNKIAIYPLLFFSAEVY